MTSSAKGILMAVLGVGLLGGIFVVFAVVVISIGLISVAGEEENSNSKTPVTSKENRDKQRNQSGVSSKKSNGETEYSTNGSISPELVGRWMLRQGGGEVDFTGKSRYRSHRRYFYEFSGNGTVEYTMEKETLTIMQCEIKERKTASGKASIEGDTLTINFGEADFAGSNSCEGGETVEKTLPAETVRLKWNLKNEGEAAKLCFEETEGEACYDKQ